MMSNDINKRALKFIVLLGIVSLFSDMTYEGARSITGPFLGVLGASATVVGFVAGLGELIGYALRLLAGYLSDRTGKYWTITFFGYALNLFAVPMLALAGRWEIAASLMIAERMGKAVRTPARDAMLSYATRSIGHGWGFGLHEAMDQIGAILGPLIVAAVYYYRGEYRTGFIVLLIPAVIAISVLIAARVMYPRPRDLDISVPGMDTRSFRRLFWFYLGAVALVAVGYVDYPLIAFHYQKMAVVPPVWIPVFYSVAMGVDALAALLFGRLFDRIGLSVLVYIAVVSVFITPLVFLGGFGLALAGTILWGVGMGAQESIMRAAVAGMVGPEKRGTAFGVFNTGYGLAWFAGSVLMGILYDTSIPLLVAFSISMQIFSIPLFLAIRKKNNHAI